MFTLAVVVLGLLAVFMIGSILIAIITGVMAISPILLLVILLPIIDIYVIKKLFKKK